MTSGSGQTPTMSPGSPDDRDLPPVVDDPDVDGVDEGETTDDVDESPKSDVPDLDEDEADASGDVIPDVTPPA